MSGRKALIAELFAVVDVIIPVDRKGNIIPSTAVSRY